MNPQILRSSLALVVERQPMITPRFYEILFERYPQAKPLFGRNKPETQQKMLQDAIVAVVDHVEDASWLKEQLFAMGVRHKDYSVTPEMFAWVGECLLATLAEVAGPEWSPEVAASWTEAYGAITALMLEGYKSLTR